MIVLEITGNNNNDDNIDNGNCDIIYPLVN